MFVLVDIVLKLPIFLFADDIILFGKVSFLGAHVLKDILLEYGRASGQVVNYNKSVGFCSANTGMESRRDVENILGIKFSSNPEKYLGLPNVMGRQKKGFVSIPKR